MTFLLVIDVSKAIVLPQNSSAHTISYTDDLADRICLYTSLFSSLCADEPSDSIIWLKPFETLNLLPPATEFRYHASTLSSLSDDPSFSHSCHCRLLHQVQEVPNPLREVERYLCQKGVYHPFHVAIRGSPPSRQGLIRPFFFLTRTKTDSL